MDRCFDCGKPCADTVCAACLAIADERDYLTAYCRSEHSGIGCNCLVESVALARELSRVQACNAEMEAV